MLSGHFLPEVVADVVAVLADLEVDDLSHAINLISDNITLFFMQKRIRNRVLRNLITEFFV